MEHLYPANPEALPLMKQTLNVGLEIKLERTHDISSVIHAERLVDGRMMITAVPLLYGSYTVTRGLGTFRLEPPLSLNLAAGWPLFKAPERKEIEQHHAENQQKTAIAQGGPISVPGFGASATPPPAANELVRVEQAIAIRPPPAAPVLAKNEKLANPTPPPKGKRGKKQKLESPPPAATPAQPVIAQKPAAPNATPFTLASAATPPKASCGYTSASHEHRQCSSSSSRQSRFCSNRNASASSASSTGSARRFQCSSRFKRGRWQLENIFAGQNAAWPADRSKRSA